MDWGNLGWIDLVSGFSSRLYFGCLCGVVTSDQTLKHLCAKQSISAIRACPSWGKRKCLGTEGLISVTHPLTALLLPAPPLISCNFKW